MENVSLTISKEIVQPIVEAKIKEALVAAMGGQDKLIASVVGQIINQKVDSEGKMSRYDSDNKFSWLDITITRQIQDAVKKEIQGLMTNSVDAIRKELIKQMSSKAGISQIAGAMVKSIETSFSNEYRANVNISFQDRNDPKRNS